MFLDDLETGGSCGMRTKWELPANDHDPTGNLSCKKHAGLQNTFHRVKKSTDPPQHYHDNFWFCQCTGWLLFLVFPIIARKNQKTLKAKIVVAWLVVAGHGDAMDGYICFSLIMASVVQENFSNIEKKHEGSHIVVYKKKQLTWPTPASSHQETKWQKPNNIASQKSRSQEQPENSCCQGLLCPVGTVVSMLSSHPPTGWFFCRCFNAACHHWVCKMHHNASIAAGCQWEKQTSKITIPLTVMCQLPASGSHDRNTAPPATLHCHRVEHGSQKMLVPN